MDPQRATDPLAEPLKLRCGAVLPNRICKAAMTEGLADARAHPIAAVAGRLAHMWIENRVGAEGVRPGSPIRRRGELVHVLWTRTAA